MSTVAVALTARPEGGDPRAALGAAVAVLRGMGTVARVSRPYALGPAAGAAGSHLGAVVRLETALAPEAVLAGCLGAGRTLGRPLPAGGARRPPAVDFALLLSDREVLDGPGLRLPHPGLRCWPWVASPLAEVWPDAVRPGGGRWPSACAAADRAALTALVGATWPPVQDEPPAPAQDLLAEAARRRARGLAPLHVFAEVGSTADVLRMLAAMGAPHGSLVVAERQSGGRGRHGRTWWAAPYGSLLVSCLLRDAAPLGGLLALLVGLAVVEAVGAAGGERLRLKWPNDVVAWDGRKVAGVLVERTADGATLVGIGINLSAPGPEAPAEVRARAAFVGEGGRPTARAILLRHLAARLERLAAEAGERGHGVLLARWRAHAPMLGQPVTVRPTTGGAVLAGIARDVASDGALIVARSDGTEVRVHAGEVTLAPVPP